MAENTIEFQYRARYFQIGNIDSTTKHIIFALHGYGQQAKYFLKKFSHLEDHKVCIIAPEGLNRFYLEGFDGRVGATWMTREDRETDIHNYISYLNAIYIQLKEHIGENTQVTILGFSQGAATASRWIADGLVKFDNLTLWAGIFPPDMNILESSQLLKDKKITYIYGTQDKFITPERLEEMSKISASLKVTPSILTFEGEHTLDENILTKLFVNNGR